MNTQTAVATYVFGLLVVVLIGVATRRMRRGWRRRAERQAELVGELPTAPDVFGPAVTPPTPGLYLGSTLAPNWLERVNAADLGYRCRAVLTGYPDGILLERLGASPIWMPRRSVASVGAVRALAGKVLPGRGGQAGNSGADPAGGILAIRWALPSGTLIDTGFRADDRRDHARWVSRSDDKAVDLHSDSTGGAQ